MSRRISIFLILLFSTNVLVRAAIDIPLRYVKYPEKPRTTLPSGSAEIELTLVIPEGDWKLPSLNSQKPVYAVVPLGDHDCLMVIDTKDAEAEFHSRIYLDVNGNRDLTDDPVIEGTVKERLGGRYARVDLPVIDTTVVAGGASLPFSFRLQLRVMGSLLGLAELEEETLYLSLYPGMQVNCMYTGTLQLAGESLNVFLVDSNCNGRFDDTFSVRKFERAPPGRLPISAQGDHFYLTEADNPTPFDSQVLGEWLVIGDMLYRLSIYADLSRITLTPVTENLGLVDLGIEPELMSLYTEDEEHSVMMYRPDQNVKVPRGMYRLLYYKEHRKDPQGDRWRLRARGTNESPFLAVGPGGPVSLSVGEPYTPFVTARERAGNSISLSFRVEGRGKELLYDLSHFEGDRTEIAMSETRGAVHRPKEPTYRIVKADGEIVTQGNFEYG